MSVYITMARGKARFKLRTAQRRQCRRAQSNCSRTVPPDTGPAQSKRSAPKPTWTSLDALNKKFPLTDSYKIKQKLASQCRPGFQHRVDGPASGSYCCAQRSRRLEGAIRLACGAPRDSGGSTPPNSNSLQHAAQDRGWFKRFVAQALGTGAVAFWYRASTSGGRYAYTTCVLFC